MNNKLVQRFSELDAEILTIESTKGINLKAKSILFSDLVIDSQLLITWKIKCRHLLSIACGEQSQHFLAFDKSDIPSNEHKIFVELASIFKAAKSDFEGGYFTPLKRLLQAEVFESELEQAEELLNNGYKLAAAVITGVVLETSLRDLCDGFGIIHGKLDAMNAQLAKQGIYNKLQQKQITALADIRNSAAHGKPDEFTDADVRNMIRDTKSFLDSFLSKYNSPSPSRSQ